MSSWWDTSAESLTISSRSALVKVKEVLPAKGQYTCAILQTNNGKRLDEGKVYPSNDAALAGGLDELRARLGW